LMTSTLSKDLFQRAIAESGTSFSHPLSPLAAAERPARHLPQSQGCNRRGGLEATASTDRAATAGVQVQPESVLALRSGYRRLGHRPPAGFGLCAGEEAAIPLLFGTTSRELGAAIYRTPTAQDALRKTIADYFGGLAPQALAAYGLSEGAQASDDPLYGSPADQWAVDLRFRCPATAQGGWHNAAHHPTYEYEFAHAIPGQEAQGAVHGSELPYVFGYFPKWATSPASLPIWTSNSPA